MVRIRTVLNSLAYGIALLGFVPLFPYLETVPRLVFPAALAIGVVADRKERTVKAWLPTVASMLFFFLYATRFSRNDLVGPAVNLLVILLGVRLFCEKSARNCLQIYALAIFSLAGSSLFSLSALFLCYFIPMVLLIAVSLVLLTFESTSASRAVSRSSLDKIVSVAMVLPVGSLPLIFLFFFILPRTQYPLWSFLNVGGAKGTGFSERVAPGSAPAVEEGRNAAFRVSCARLPQSDLYWRGIVLNSFEGNAWVRREPAGPEERVAGKGEAVRQTIFPEPGRASYLLVLNVPRTVSGIRYLSAPDRSYQRKGAPSGHEKYEAESVPGAALTVKKGGVSGLYLQLPADVPERMVTLGKTIAGRAGSDARKVALLEEYFQGARLSYGTTGLPVGKEPLAEFLFDKKRGNCEFFASSFALLLRSVGVPARLVGGYYGGNYNELGGYYLITEDMAHVWVEAFVAGKGWVTVDPSRWAVNFSGVSEKRKREGRTISMVLDALGYYWNQTVINYDLERQMRMISSANSGLKRLKVPARLRQVLLHAGVLVAIVAGALVFLCWKRVTPEERVLRAFLRKVKREYGVEVSRTTGLHGLAAALGDPSAGRFVEIYAAALYSDRKLSAGELRELKVLVEGVHNHNNGNVSRPGGGSPL
jgi:transglutaminase-like putative cysteine protease